ncbi:MAG: pyridoxal-phosphate dependent enzyme [Candidatus Magasanikbacteria bacterium]|nr:pyridoxal-phosphate dependent enzyme [Candidatus Magasanikbacteria bacterium]
MFKKTLDEELKRARTIPLTRIEHAGSEIFLFRADLLEAGVKRSIGCCLLAHYLETGRANESTQALVVHGAGNTVSSVKLAVEKFGLKAEVIAVIYAETSARVIHDLKARDIDVVAAGPRSEGQRGRLSVAEELCSRESGYVLIEQHEEPLIVDIQNKTFGRRIAEGIRDPTHFIAGVGTGGTVFGIGAALRKANPKIKVIALEGVGSTLSLWQAYARVQDEPFEKQKIVIEKTLSAYADAGMIVSLETHPDADREEWFEISIDFPESTEGVLGIEGLGVGNPTELIKNHISMLNAVRIVTDTEAARGMEALEAYGIRAVESAGANFFAALRLAEELQSRGEKGRIITIVTASSSSLIQA